MAKKKKKVAKATETSESLNDADDWTDEADFTYYDATGVIESVETSEEYPVEKTLSVKASPASLTRVPGKLRKTL